MSGVVEFFFLLVHKYRAIVLCLLVVYCGSQISVSKSRIVMAVYFKRKLIIHVAQLCLNKKLNISVLLRKNLSRISSGHNSVAFPLALML